MKRGAIIWLLVLFCCIFIGVRQRRNLSIFWREYRSVWRDYDYDYHECKFVLHKPLIPERIARTNSETVSVVNIALGNYEQDESLLALAESLLKFPDNEFFLFSCANEIFRLTELDQEIAVKLAEKLIDLDKDNSLYHYLRATFLLANRQNNDIMPALDEINTAATCPNFYFPYAKYTQRAIAMAERASLHPALVELLSLPHFLYDVNVRQISDVLLRYAHRAFTDGEHEKGILIDDAINSIGRNQLDAGYNEAKLIMNRKDLYHGYHFYYWSCPEILELQRVDLTKQRAWQNRLQLCPYALPRIKSEETKNPKDSNLDKKPRVTNDLIVATPIAVHNGRMLFAMTGVWLVLIATCMVRGWRYNQKTGLKALLLFVAASICYFFVINVGFFGELRAMYHCCFSHISIMRPRPLQWLGWGQIIGHPFYFFLFLIYPIMATLLIWIASRPRIREMSFWWKMLLKLILTIVASAIEATLLGILMYFAHEWMSLLEFLPVVVSIFILTLPAAVFASWISRLKLARVILAAVLLGVLTIFMSPYAYISQIPLILFVVVCTLIVVNNPYEPIPFMKALPGVFSKRPESAVICSKAVKLLAPFIIIHWLLFVTSVPICAQYIDRLYSDRPWRYPKTTWSPPDETSYQKVLARFDSNDLTLTNIPRLMLLVMPEDLPSVLNIIRDKDFTSSSLYRFLEISAERSDETSLRTQDQLGKKFNDLNIIDVMQGCGRDVINILADSMDNPEREFAMISRARLGDARVKTKLEHLLALRLQSSQPPKLIEWHHYWDRPAKPVDIICALACISEPNEAGARFLDYVTRCDVSKLAEEDEFFRGIPLLPMSQAREVIKAYLAKAQEWQPPERVRLNGEIFNDDPSRALSPSVREVVGIYADRDIAEAVFKIMLRSQDNDIVKLWEPWEVPQVFDAQSVDLLRQGLASSNDQLRAWCVQQLRRIGYTFSEDEISRLLADESWKVRANLVVAVGPKTAGRFANDPNPFVRWIASLIAGNVEAKDKNGSPPLHWAA